MEAEPVPYEAIPAGWFCVAFSRELRCGRVRPVRYFGRELVLYRTGRGQAVLADAYCPHLGAHLGHGGCVEGEELRCPFHGLKFAADGHCTATPYRGKAPPAARLGVWPLREMHGVVLAWFDPTGRPPVWEVPDHPVAGWSRLEGGSFPLRSHPQETSENSVDLGHFTQLHGFLTAAVSRPLETRGPLLTVSYAVTRSLDFLGLPRRGMRVEFDVEVHGLGYSRVEARLPGLGVTMLHLVLSTPVDESHVHLRVGSRVRRLPVPGLAALAAKGVYHGLRFEVRQDFEVWRHKRYVRRPALAQGDGPIAAYRRWCRQFYPAVAPAALGRPAG